MCLGASTRVSQGGSIAVLRPTRQSDSSDEMLLLFSNQFAYPGTRVELQGWDGKDTFRQDRHWVVIHRDGDLSAAPRHTPSNPLFSFPLDSSTEAVVQLSQWLDLGVGEAGVIGRRVSVMTGSIKGPLTVAEGIMGWN